MQNEDIKKKLAPCGLHCGQCFAFRDSAIHQSAVQLKKYLGNFEPYAERFSTLLNPVFKNYPVFQEFLDYLVSSECGGCREEQCKFYKNCNVRRCAAQKDVDYCCQCPQFPCEETGLDENLYRRHVSINKKIREIGSAAYYEEIKDLPRY